MSDATASPEPAADTRISTRHASVMQVGGFRPTNQRDASHFGLTPLALPGDEWPALNGKPLLFVCQFNLAAAPVVPAALAGIALLTFFVKAGKASLKKENGQDWHLRAYKSLDPLVPLLPPANAPGFKRGFECRWEEVEDHPEDDSVHRTKIGGFPVTIQSDPWWDYKAHPANPQYCLQIVSEEKVGLAWGDDGVVYIAKGTAAGFEDQWFLDLQSY